MMIELLMFNHIRLFTIGEFLINGYVRGGDCLGEGECFVRLEDEQTMPMQVIADVAGKMLGGSRGPAWRSDCGIGKRRKLK